MKKYQVTLKHDNGLFGMIVQATSLTNAIDQVIKAENCPETAIILIKTIK